MIDESTAEVLMYQVGQRFKLKSKPFKALDGNTYNIFTIAECGRGWMSRNSYIIKDKDEIEVEVLPSQDMGGIYAKAVRLKLNNKDLQWYRISKRPYVRKDGTFDVVSYIMYERPYGCYWINGDDDHVEGYFFI